MKHRLITLLPLSAPVAAQAQSSTATAPGASAHAALSRAVAALTGEPGGSLDSWIAFAAVGIAIVLAALYLRGIYLVLHYASETYDVNLNPVDDEEYSSHRERLLLYVGSALLVVGSALIISSYGFGWLFLYAGPAITLFGPLVIILSMGVDIRKYRQALGITRQPPAEAQPAGRIPLNQPAA